MSPEKKKISFEEFIEIDKISDEHLEYIDGQIYALNDEELYEQVGVYKNNEIAESIIFNDLRINLDDIF